MKTINIFLGILIGLWIIDVLLVGYCIYSDYHFLHQSVQMATSGVIR